MRQLYTLHVTIIVILFEDSPRCLDASYYIPHATLTRIHSNALATIARNRSISHYRPVAIHPVERRFAACLTIIAYCSVYHATLWHCSCDYISHTDHDWWPRCYIVFFDSTWSLLVNPLANRNTFVNSSVRCKIVRFSKAFLTNFGTQREVAKTWQQRPAAKRPKCGDT